MTSSYRESSNKRRNERQTKVPVIRPPGSSKKDTKRWCRGKVGVDHKPVCIDYNDHKHTRYRFDVGKEWKILICSECKKELDTWWPSPWRKTATTPPDWVK